MNRLLILLLLAALLAACSPSAEELALQSQQAASSTTADWTDTPTSTAPPTATPAPSATPTVTAVPSPTPTPIGGGGKIAFSLFSITGSGSSPSHFLMDPEGSNLSQIYDHDGLPDEAYLGWEHPGTFSPDGNFYAIHAVDFTETATGEWVPENAALVIINTQTQEQTLIELEEAWADFGWSPSGAFFYYSQSYFSPNQGVFNTNDWENLIRFPDYQIFGMPNEETLIVLPDPQVGAGYKLIDLEGSILAEWPEFNYHYGCEYVDPSVEWCYALIQDYNENIDLERSGIYKWFFNGSEPETLVELEAYIFEFSLSPEKDLMTYAHCPLSMSPDSSCSLALFDLSTNQHIPVPNDSNSPIFPVFSPDGRFILYKEVVPGPEGSTPRSWFTLLEWETGAKIEIDVDLDTGFVGPPVWAP